MTAWNTDRAELGPEAEPWRRWTGIEPAGRGSPVPTALKAAEPTRCPDTSAARPNVRVGSVTRRVGSASHGRYSRLTDFPMYPPPPSGTGSMVMVTLCWAAKGGSGTTVVTAALALGFGRHSLLVDLDGELPAVLGMPDPDRPGIDDWLRSDAHADQLDELVVDADATTSLLPLRRTDGATRAPSPIDDTTLERVRPLAAAATRRRDRGLRRRRLHDTARRPDRGGRPGVARDPALLSVAAACERVRRCGRPG